VTTRLLPVVVVLLLGLLLGCAKPGTAYTQALVEGSRITLRADGAEHEYHQGGSEPPFRCADPTE
jgi:hypothetical protein